MSVEIREAPSGSVPVASVDSAIPIYIGTAPINSVDLTNVNKVKIAYNETEFAAAFGAIAIDHTGWSLHEAAKAHFRLFGTGPIICVNVINPSNNAHKATATDQSHQLVGGEVQLQVYGGADEPMLGVIKSTVVIKKAGVTKTLGTDYTLDFDADGYLVVSIVSGGAFSASDVLTATFSYLDPTGVTSSNVIGGYSAGAYTGLELVKQAYPRLRKIPALINAPGWSHVPAVAARMHSLAASLPGGFKSFALTDLTTDSGVIATYADAADWKAANGYTSKHSAPGWPKGKIGDDVYHISTLIACVAGLTDASNDGVPYAAPSNKDAVITSAVLNDGTEVSLDGDQANSLRDQGISTLVNGFNGWRTKATRTGAYPGNTDPKDAFLPVRRMFSWFENVVIMTTDQYVDGPINRRLIEVVVDSLQLFINKLVNQGALATGSKIEFRAEDNSITDLANGTVTWFVTLAPPSPAETLSFLVRYDANLLASLFDA